MIDKDQLINDFFELVKIPGPSKAEAEIADYIKMRLKAIDAEVFEDDAGEKIGGNTGNLICSVRGTKINAKPILLAAHMDTVQPCQGINPQIENGLIKSDGSTILGADDRAGVAVILHALNVLKEKDIEHGDLEIVFTVGEEIGLLGSSHLDVTKLRSKIGFVFDCSKPPGKVVIQAPTSILFKAKCIGKASHAAAAPEKGINAIHFAAKAIAACKFGKIEDGLVSSIGLITGGRALNIVPDELTAEGFVRSFEDEKLEKYLSSLNDSFKNEAQKVGGKVEFEQKLRYRSFCLDENDRVVQIALEALRENGLEAEGISYLGGSDANHLNAKGIETVNVGLGVNNVHSTEESIEATSIVYAAETVLNIIKICSSEN